MNAPQPVFTLTDGQQNAHDKFCQFLLDEKQNVFVLEGYAGTGKTTLVQTLLADLPKIEQSIKLINPKFPGWDIQLTATTNKACEALHELSGEPVATIHSFLGLRVHKDYSTGEKTLRPRNRNEIKEGTVILIDEASYLDAALLRLIFQMTRDCKIVFIGDPAQLTQVGSTHSPVFSSGFPTARLTEVVRQAEGNPIIDLATAFRNTVSTGNFFSFVPDGISTEWMSREKWAEEIKKEFTDPTWTHARSKVLAWTNKTVIAYNHAIRDIAHGDPEFQEGDYAVLNSYMAGAKGSYPLRTDELVQITSKSGQEESLDTPGWFMTLNGRQEVFMPLSLEHRKARIRRAKKEQDLMSEKLIDETWADLRAAYSCTINKSQGSTYDKVFIDLDDIRGCNSPNQIARMLYVAVSRARYKVNFVGDIV